VYIQGTVEGSTSDVAGNFSFFTQAEGKQVLAASMIGMETGHYQVLLDGSPISIKIILKAQVSELAAVEITAGQFETGEVAQAAVLSSIDVATTAGATADIFGALKTLPGTMPAMEQDGLLVRGGDAYETRTYFDGLRVNQPFTSDIPDIAQRGRFSPFMFKGTSFSTGAFGAAYGDALSSVMSMESKDLVPKTKSDIGIMSVGFDATHAHRFENSSLEIGGSYYNLGPVYSVVEQNTQWLHEPESFQGNAFYKTNTGADGLFKYFGSYEQSHTGLIAEHYVDITRETAYDIRSENMYFNSTWQGWINNQLKAEAGASYGNDADIITMDSGRVRQSDRSFHGRAVVTGYPGKQTEITGGAEYFTCITDEQFGEWDDQLINPVISGFTELKTTFSGKWSLRPGARFDHAVLTGHNTLSPRISMAYKWSEHAQVSAGAGMFSQVPESEFLLDNKNLDFEKATHVVLNYQYQKGKKTFRGEAYYKKYDDLVSGSEDSLRSTGVGYAKGIDLFWRDSETFRYADYWISCSLTDSKRKYRDYPERATPSFVSPVVVNVVGKYFFPKLHTSLGATFTYATGRTYYDPNSTEFMSGKTRDYYNFSLNLSYLTSLAGRFTILYLSVENVFGIENVYGYKYTPDGAIRKAIVPSAPRNIFIGVFVTFGDDEYR
jgi:hypothetical protein